MNTRLCRRSFIKASALAAAGRLATVRQTSSAAVRQSGRSIAHGPFQPTWESLVQNYRVPEWFRDAKFGIWAHWSAQCVPEQGDWYARNMYRPGDHQYKYHLEHYGHPSKIGFKDIDYIWQAEQWNPDRLMQLYQRA